jgi:hypothetical protein
MRMSDDQNPGFHFYVTEEQVRYHRKRSIKDIFKMNEDHAKFLFAVQTKAERLRTRLIKGKGNTL